MSAWVVVPVEPAREMIESGVRSHTPELGTVLAKGGSNDANRIRRRIERIYHSMTEARPTGPEVPVCVDASELESLRRDAERYRWLRENARQTVNCWTDGYGRITNVYGRSAESIDGTCDAAIAQEKAK